MRARPPMSTTVCRFGVRCTRLTALGVLLCLGILLTASGPHLVHHLADLGPGHSHTRPSESQPTDCLVLFLMQHLPLIGDLFIAQQAPLPIAGAACWELIRQLVAPHRAACQARSPPTTLFP
jgi:hypothetical protein